MSRRFLFNFQGANESLNFTSNTQTIGNVYMTGGNVGINTTSPSVRLDVSGDLQATNVSTGTLQATNAVSTNVSTGTLQAPSGITVGNINFTGSLYQNGTPYLGSQWTTTSGNVSYTSGSVVASNLVATNSTVTNVQATNVSAGTLQAPNVQATAISAGNVAISGNLSVAGTLTTVNLTTTNLIDTNISAGSANITNATITTLTAATARFTNEISTNVSSATLNLSTGVTSASAQLTNANVTTLTAATAVIASSTFTGSSIEIGAGRVADGVALIDFHTAEATYGDFSLRLIRESGANGNTILRHRGTGAITYDCQEAGTHMWTTSGTERMRLTAAGNVGIGTASPSATLHIGTGNNNLSVTTSNMAFSWASGGYNHYITSRHMSTAGSNQNAIDFWLNNSTAASASSAPNVGNVIGMSVTATGVGIATTNPSYTLDVNGSGRITNAVATNVSSATLNLSTGVTSASAQLTNANVTTLTAGTARVTSNLLAIGNSNTLGNLFTTGGNVGISTSSPSARLQVNGQYNTGTFISVVKDGVASWGSQSIYDNTRFITCTGNGERVKDFNVGPGGVGIGYAPPTYTTNSADGLYVNGNVGIGTSAPAYTLDVNGTGRITNLNATNATIANYMFTNMTANNLVASNVNLGVSSLFSGSFIASNNVTAASNVTGLSFSNSAIGAFTATVDVTIIATGSLYSMYTIRGYQNASGWNLATSNLGDATGITFTITSSGQVQYVSSNVTGFTSSTFRYNVQQFTNTGTYTSLLVNTQGSYIVDTIQINSTTDSIRGTSNGGLYTLGGATITKSLNILDTDNATGVGSGGSLTVLGGAAVSSNLIVGGSITAANLALSGNLSVAGTLTTVNLTTTNLIDTNITAGAANITNATITTLTAATLNATTGITTGRLHLTSSGIGLVMGTSNGSTLNSLVQNAYGTFETCIAAGTQQYSSSAIAGDVILRTAPSKNLLLQTGSGASMVYIASSGNVGIGTSAPACALDVNGSIEIPASNSSGSYRITTNVTDNFIHQSTTVGHYSLMWNLEAGLLGHTAYLTAWGGIKLFTQGQQRMVISSSGNVGIGTSAPAYALDVNGTINCNNNVQRVVPYWSAYRSTTLTLTNSVDTAMIYDTTDVLLGSTGLTYASSSGSFINTSGRTLVVSVSYSIQFLTLNASGMRQAYIYYNGNKRYGQQSHPGSSSDLQNLSSSSTLRLNNNDYFQIWAWQNSGSSITINSGVNANHVEIALL